MRRQVGWVALGFLGTAIFAWLALWLSPVGEGFITSFSSLSRHLIAGSAGIIALVLLAFAWLGVRGLRLRHQWLVWAVWILPLLLVPPLLTKDGWAYADQGWIVLQGADPYVTAMGSVTGPFSFYVDAFWYGTTTVYPPLALLVQAGLVAATGAHGYWSVIAMRLPALLGVVLIGLLVPSMARRVGLGVRGASWAILLNPLVIVHLVGGAHNDALAAGLAVAGAWLAVVGRGTRAQPWAWLVGCAVIGLAMGIKQPVGLAMVGAALFGVVPAQQAKSVFGKALWRQYWLTALGRVAAGFLVTMGTFVALCAVTLGFGWATGTGSPATVGTNSPSYLVAGFFAWALQLTTAEVLPVVAVIGLGIGGLAILWLLWRQGLTQPIGFMAWSLLVLVFTSPSLQPWYLLWGGVFLGATWVTTRQLALILSVSVLGVMTAVMQEYGGMMVGLSSAIAVVAVIPLARLLYRQIRDAEVG